MNWTKQLLGMMSCSSISTARQGHVQHRTLTVHICYWSALMSKVTCTDDTLHMHHKLTSTPPLHRTAGIPVARPPAANIEAVRWCAENGQCAADEFITKRHPDAPAMICPLTGHSL
jgi:hypothetical protein